ncbi:YbhB/YbcL family Raf kinase inhibitor-like protein [Shewanella sp. SNU WT4]|uniref:YbhB/YbcL family Raf kinase inhibitor-like protein n=1 Tax=Shewanella sp. SNU WT4 TaxID=2590015 RepID=UPI00112B9DD4|nr:YbhB/YbcL family Raf kinase inhibitor-like protein [Shewanella sp. SNU WT4]QDF66204.1 YbhB/YbcL family Raf kinase inhibitor-like protein [Shewanella sp. SNU WT4]
MKQILSISCALALFSASSAYALTLESPQVTNDKTFSNQQIFDSWGCTGDNISPELKWSDVPKGTKSFAVTLYDPNAPTGSGWWHWVTINIPADATGLSLGAGALGGDKLPKGASMLRNDFGFMGYGGACPPPMAQPHNYEITVYALDVADLGVPVDASPALAGYYILQHDLAKAVLTAPTNTR